MDEHYSGWPNHMNLRDLFAVEALRQVGDKFGRLPETAELLAKKCYEVADAFLKVRKLPSQGESNE